MIYNALNQKEPSKLSIVMPVLNEGVRVIPVVTTLAFTIKIPIELIVIYDSETDPTIEILEGFMDIFPGLRLVKNEEKGVIGALRTGFRKSVSDHVIIWVSYAVDPFGLVNDMYQLAINGADLVSGNRFNKVKRITRGNPIKKILSRGGNYLLNRLIGIPLGDITTSCKLYRREFLLETPMETKISGGWALSAELTVKAALRNFKFAEVEFLPQNANLIQGISNFRVFKHLDQYVKWLYMGFKNRKIIRKNYPKKTG